MTRIVSFVLVALTPTLSLAADRAPDPRPAGTKVRLGTPGFRAQSYASHALMPDGKTIISARGRELVFTSLATGHEVNRVPLEKVERRTFDRWPHVRAILASGTSVLLDYASGDGVGGDGGFAVFDIKTGDAVFTFDTYVFAVSANASRALVRVSEDWDDKQVVRIVEPDSGKTLAEFKSATRDIYRGAFSDDGTRVAIFRLSTKDVQICDATTGKEVARLPATVQVWRALFSPDAKTILTAGDIGAVQLWDAITGKPIHAFAAKFSGVDKLVFDADGSRVGVIFHKRDPHQVWFPKPSEFRVWDAKTGEPIARSDLEATGIDLVLPTGKPGVALGLHRVTDEPVQKFAVAALRGGILSPTGGHIRAITAIQFTQDGKRVVTADGGRRVVTWDAITGSEIARATDPGETARDGSSAVFRPDGGAVAFTDSLGAKVFDLTTAKRAFSVGDEYSMRLAGWSADGARLLLFINGTGIVFDTKTHKALAKVEADGPESEFALFPNGKVVVSATPKGIPQIGRMEFEFVATDTATGKKLASYRGPYANRSGLTPLLDNRTVVITYGDYSGLIWDAVTGKEVRRFDGAPVAVSADGKLMVLGVNELLPMPGDLKLAWEWFGGLLSRERRGSACGHGFKRDYRTRLLVVDVATGAVRFEVPSEREGAPPMAFSPDGKTLAVVEPDDTTVLLWDLARPASKR